MVVVIITIIIDDTILVNNLTMVTMVLVINVVVVVINNNNHRNEVEITTIMAIQTDERKLIKEGRKRNEKKFLNIEICLLSSCVCMCVESRERD